MEQLTTVSSLNSQAGEYLFTYADQYNLYFILYATEEDRVYLVIADKRRNIEAGIPLTDSASILFKAEQVKWFKPVQRDSDTTFLGRVFDQGKKYHFTFSENSGKFVLEENDVSYDRIPDSYALLSCLEDIEVVHGIQRNSFFYFTGYQVSEDGGKETVVGKVDMALGKVSNIYFLYSDLGEIFPSAISIDHHDDLIYVVGKLVTEEGQVTPYMDAFLYQET